MKKEDKIPEFNSLEEEKAYWEERAKAPGRWIENKPQKRSSFLAVRLNGEEITRLRDAAAKQGVPLSTFTRQALVKAGETKKTMTLTQAIELLASGITDEDRERLKSMYDSIAIPSLENPMLLYFDKNDMNQAMYILVKAIYATQGVQVETRDSESDNEDSSGQIKLKYASK